MFGLGIIEVGIGLALVFLSVSLVCSTVREVIETIAKSRAMDLERGLRELLDDKTGTGFTKSLFSHPIVYGLFGGDYDPSKLAATWGLAGIGEGKKMPMKARRSLPSYIPAGHFSAALLDLMVRGSSKRADGAAMPGNVYPTPALSIQSLRAAATALESEPVRRAVLSALDLSGGDLAKVRANLESWFNGTMDRVSGWYKRRTQMFLFFIGLGVAVGLNVDAITIADRLGTDAALRAAVVGQAEKVVRDGMPATTEQIDKIQTDLDQVGLPVGWVDWRPGPQSKVINGKRRIPTNGVILQLVLGWLITAIAVLLGAPFWFDVLNKFMVIRSTVKPHEKSPEEGSEDRQPARPASQPAAAAPPPPPAGAAAPGPAVGGAPPPPAPAAAAIAEGYEPREWNTPGSENEGIL